MLQLCALETFGRTGLQIGVSGRVLLSLLLKTFPRTLSSKTANFAFDFQIAVRSIQRQRRLDEPIAPRLGAGEPQNIPLIPLGLREVEPHHGNVGAQKLCKLSELCHGSTLLPKLVCVLPIYGRMPQSGSKQATKNWDCSFR